MKPQRIQLKRNIKGWRLQEESKKLNGLSAVKCARPGKWGNPFKVNKKGKIEVKTPKRFKGDSGWVIVSTTSNHTNKDAVRLYKKWLLGEDTGFPVGDPPNPKILKDKNLACWCKEGEICHVDVLLEIANS